MDLHPIQGREGGKWGSGQSRSIALEIGPTPVPKFVILKHLSNNLHF